MKLKIALLQINAAEEKIAENLKIGNDFCRRAALSGAHIAVFPEMFSIGYPTPFNENNSFKIRAYENAMAVAICNYPAPKNDGYSTAFNPDGTYIFKANTKEGLYIAEYDLDSIRHYRKHTMFSI